MTRKPWKPRPSGPTRGICVDSLPSDDLQISLPNLFPSFAFFGTMVQKCADDVSVMAVSPLQAPHCHPYLISSDFVTGHPAITISELTEFPPLTPSGRSRRQLSPPINRVLLMENHRQHEMPSTERPSTIATVNCQPDAPATLIHVICPQPSQLQAT